MVIKPYVGNYFLLAKTLRRLCMLKLLAQYKSNEEGVTAIEYGLIAAGVAVAVAAAAALVGTDISELFGRIGTELDSATF